MLYGLLITAVVVAVSYLISIPLCRSENVSFDRCFWLSMTHDLLLTGDKPVGGFSSKDLIALSRPMQTYGMGLRGPRYNPSGDIRYMISVELTKRRGSKE